MAVCVAVIAKENYPLYIRSVPTENELKFHYMVHTSLDVVDEKISAMGKALVDQRELYLGLLYPTEDYKVYGYVTNSKVKFVMVVDSSNTALRDNEIRSMFRKLHSSYTDVMCNPFYNPGDRIQSRCGSQGAPYSWQVRGHRSDPSWWHLPSTVTLHLGSSWVPAGRSSHC
ncbi:trafficking protein particle complex subunit 2-like protein isoform X1 [Manis javanica]|uniref:trafficking protein particle complex subunit 2-like protein isoform X1 n=1 Tax=Manis javanica TaxID=9974 RepID=UPI0018793CF7|nr:trafficking protein particle complex subunit 2-like protein isoform X2 [Manis javanica]